MPNGNDEEQTFTQKHITHNELLPAKVAGTGLAGIGLVAAAKSVGTAITAAGAWIVGGAVLAATRVHRDAVATKKGGGGYLQGAMHSIVDNAGPVGLFTLAGALICGGLTLGAGAGFGAAAFFAIGTAVNNVTHSAVDYSRDKNKPLNYYLSKDVELGAKVKSLILNRSDYEKDDPTSSRGP